MARRVILDTGVLIAIERGKLDVDTVLGIDDAAIAAITAMELLVGVERADDAIDRANLVGQRGCLGYADQLESEISVRFCLLRKLQLEQICDQRRRRPPLLRRWPAVRSVPGRGFTAAGPF